MMLPGQIKNYQLNLTKQGMYNASEVEAFRQKVYVAFCEILSENNALKEKFVSLSDLVSEYNAGKNSIATALIKSQTLADETVKNAQIKADEIVSEAEKKAQSIYDAKTKEADDYVSEKTSTADDYYNRAKTELDKVLASIDEKAEKYIEDINKKATQIIADANEQASGIVSRAYLDAQKARETCDNILKNASLALPSVRNEVDMFKTETLRLLGVISEAVENISVPDDIDFVPEEIEFAEAETIDIETVPVFEMSEESDFDEIESPEEEIVEFEEIEENISEVTENKDDDSDYIFDKFSSFDDIFSTTDI